MRKVIVCPEASLDAARRGARLAENHGFLGAIREHRGLIGADDPGVGGLHGNAARLGEREPRDHGKCRLPLAAELVDAGRTAFEGLIHPCQELAAIARGGR